MGGRDGGGGLEYGSEALCDLCICVLVLCFPRFKKIIFGFLGFLIRLCDIYGLIVVIQMIYVKTAFADSLSYRFFYAVLFTYLVLYMKG